MQSLIPRRWCAALLLAAALSPAALSADANHAAHGNGEDTRHAIYLDAREKHFLLSEMRAFVAVTRQIVVGVAANDMAAVAKAAASAGLKAHKDDFANPESPVQGIRKKAPPAFFPLGRETHIGFDRIAELAAEIGDRDAVLGALGENLGRCVACHEGYRVH